MNDQYGRECIAEVTWIKEKELIITVHHDYDRQNKAWKRTWTGEILMENPSYGISSFVYDKGIEFGFRKFLYDGINQRIQLIPVDETGHGYGPLILVEENKDKMIIVEK